MATAPAQSYSILFSAFLSPLGATVPQGYAVTKSGDGKSYVVASSANLALSASGTIDGIQISLLGNPGDTVQIQRDAKIDKSIISWLGTGIQENAVVDTNGKVQRASVSAGTVIGIVDKEGGVAINLSGAVSSVASVSVTGSGVWHSTAGALDAAASKGTANQVLTTNSAGTDTLWSSALVLSALTLSSLTGATTRMVTVDTTGAVSAQAIPTTASVTGSGVWHSTSGALDAAASKGTANQVLVTNAGATDTTWATTGGDVTGAITALVVGRLQGAVVLSGTPSNGQVLTASGPTAASWVTPSSGSTITWATDLAGSSNTSQIVIAATGSAGTFTVRCVTTHLPNTGTIVARNAANSADVTALTVDASNQVIIGATSPAGIVCRTGALDLYTTGSARLTLTDTLATHSTNVAMGANAITFGTSPAAAGFIRAANNTAINFRNAANSADVQALTVDSSNQPILGSVFAGVVCLTTNQTTLYGGGSGRFTVDGNTGWCAIPTGNSLGVGNASPTFSSGTNVVAIYDGTSPTSDAGSTSTFLYSDGARITFRNGNTVATHGTDTNPSRVLMRFDAMVTRAAGADQTNCLRIVYRTPAGTDSTFGYIPIYN